MIPRLRPGREVLVRHAAVGLARASRAAGAGLELVLARHVAGAPAPLPGNPGAARRAAGAAPGGCVPGVAGLVFRVPAGARCSW
ncbi:MAG TPA: hypothetical protein VE343_10930, partial [Streptosporangiaceae bacterium]|nr:hypothetical protein [Streptosporangiaceae bacterium]